MEILAEEFSAAGHLVIIVTETPNTKAEQDCDYDVVRSPSIVSLVRLLRWSDVCLCANVSLRSLGPILIANRPFVVSHHGLYNSTSRISIVPKLKNVTTRFTNNICCSDAVRSGIPGPSVVIPNSYRSEIFKEYGDVSRDLDILFAGRLVSDKGVTDLIDALRHLGERRLRPTLSILGQGPELSTLKQRVSECGVESQVSFVGTKSGPDLARFMARHRVMAVPSRWAEPFGIVALEGAACGCVIVGTNLGGLPEAIGPCGLTVPNGDSGAMASALESLLTNEELMHYHRSLAPTHLARHSRASVARKYLDVLRSAIRPLSPTNAYVHRH
jgi:glycosyltransferase involved in cell wall biosynthesis